MSHKDETGNDICCHKFDPAPWDEKTHKWKDKLFMKNSIFQFMHMPIPFFYARKITDMWSKIKEAGADVESKNFLMLAHDPSPWKVELFMNVTKEVPGAEHARFSGTFLTKVFDGPFSEIRNWIVEMEQFVKSRGNKTKKLYFYYTTCPKCAKKYGHNYVVGFSEIEQGL